MIRIDCDVIHFSTEDHVVILGAKNGSVFDSGTHKSHLLAELNRNLRNDKLVSNKNIVIAESVYDLKNRTMCSNDCFIIDEANVKPAEFEHLLQQARVARAYLIVIGRMAIKQLECSVDSIYALEYKNEQFYIEQMFKNVPAVDVCADVVICEDHTAVAAVYDRILDYVDVRPAAGRGNFYAYCKNEAVSLLIADKPKFGQNLLRLLYELKTRSHAAKTLLLFLPACFEEVLCEAATDQVLIGSVDQTDYFDLEDYYEALADTLADWDKKHVGKSLDVLKGILDFDHTQIAQDLVKFYDCQEVDFPCRCYRIDLQDFNISVLDDVTKLAGQ